MKKPECFLSNPSYQSQVENDCFTCSFKYKCFEKKETMSLESVDDHIKELCKNPEFKEAYEAEKPIFERMREEIELQREIEDVLDAFTSRLDNEYARSYIDIRREIGRELLAKIGGYYESKR